MAQTLKWGDSNQESISPPVFEERTWGWDTAFPTNWRPGAWFFRTDLNLKYQNTGSFVTPTWTVRTGSLASHQHTASGDGGTLDETTVITIDSVDETLIDLILVYG